MRKDIEIIISANEIKISEYKGRIKKLQSMLDSSTEDNMEIDGVFLQKIKLKYESRVLSLEKYVKKLKDKYGD